MAPSWTLIRAARRDAGLTQLQVAERAGVTQAAVAHLERPGSNPTVKTLNAILATTNHRLALSAQPHASNVDDTLIARNLRMTPEQRLAAFEAAHADVGRLRGLIRHPDAG